MYGWRGRIGLVVPSSNTTCEMEFHRVVPEGVSVHTARVFLLESDSITERIAQIRAMEGRLEQAVTQVASVEPQVIVWACTAGSFLGGAQRTQELTETLQRIAKVPVVTTSGAVVDALRALGVRRVAMVTPYVDSINEHERAFLEACLPGLTVVRSAGAGIVGNLPKGRLFPESAYAAARAIFGDDIDAVFVSCTNWRTLEVLDALEADLGKPVISSVQASVWRALRVLGVRAVSGSGRLLRDVAP